MNRLIIYILSAFLFLLAGCKTFEITEADAFDPNRTITPETFNVQPYQLHETTLESEDGESLNAWFLERDDAEATVIYFGGNDFLLVTSRAFLEAYSVIPVNLLLFDYRGYGQSSGTPTVAGLQTDARVVYNYARSAAPDLQDDIYVHGHSIGTFLAAMLADEADVAGYILESPVTEVNRWTRRLVPWIARPFVRFNIADTIQEQSNLERVARTDKPLLIMGGSNDQVTPFRMAEELYEASVSSQKNLVNITGGAHNNLSKSVEYRQALQTFFN